MRKKFQNIKAKTVITCLLFVLCVIMAVFLVLDRLNQDNTPPSITFATESIQLTEEEASAVLQKDYSCLLTGVSAFDDSDGDITDRVIVYSVNIYGDHSYAVVNYRALDRSNNMATAQRLAYLKSPEQIYQEFLDSLSNGPADGTGDAATENNAADESDTQRPVIQMESVVNLAVGETFEPQEYLITLEDDVDSFETLAQNCRMEGEFDVNSAGIYPLVFYVTDSDGNESEPSVLILTVGLNDVG
ncbi:MAG TPA: hypothetical protein IAC15_09375 [Candidatus Onthomonas avicola]|nr:hypothetical protein [Candidatus Onthomonas avicola]